MGLWLPYDAAHALLADRAELVRLRGLLTELGLEVVTLNGFPYRGFHQEVVKYRVYSPDWGCADRLGYTLALAEILAALLPDDVTEGTISTLPLAWRTGWTGAKADATARMLAELARGLRELSGRAGKVIRVGFEPEPGCVVETTAQAARHLRDVDRDFLGVCLDACHLAVGFEDPAIGALDAADRQAPGRRARSRRRRRRTPRWRRSTSRASCTSPAPPPASPTTWPRRWRVACRPGRPGGCTSTCRCTPRPRPRSPPRPPTCATCSGDPGRRHRAAHPARGGRDLHVVGAAPEGGVTTGGLAEGMAAELDWTRRELLALGLKEL